MNQQTPLERANQILRYCGPPRAIQTAAAEFAKEIEGYRKAVHALEIQLAAAKEVKKAEPKDEASPLWNQTGTTRRRR